MGVLCALSLAGCMKKDLYQAPEEKTADEYFGFTTSSSCTVDLNYGLNYQVVFEQKRKMQKFLRKDLVD